MRNNSTCALSQLSYKADVDSASRSWNFRPNMRFHRNTPPNNSQASCASRIECDAEDNLKRKAGLWPQDVPLKMCRTFPTERPMPLTQFTAVSANRLVNHTSKSSMCFPFNNSDHSEIFPPYLPCPEHFDPTQSDFVNPRSVIYTNACGIHDPFNGKHPPNVEFRHNQLPNWEMLPHHAYISKFSTDGPHNSDYLNRFQQTLPDLRHNGLKKSYGLRSQLWKSSTGVMLTIPERLQRLALFLKDDRCNRVNDIQTIENAITSCHLALKTKYEVDEVCEHGGHVTYTGKLSMSDVFLARSVGQVKRELKQECYKLALQVMRKKPVSDIIMQSDIGTAAIRVKFDECSTPGSNTSIGDVVDILANTAPISVALETVATLKERWVEFIDHVKASSDTANIVSRIEMSLRDSRCGLLRTYELSASVDRITGKPGFTGTLVIGGLVQAHAFGVRKKDAKQKVYSSAFERFISLALDDILKPVLCSVALSSEIKMERQLPDLSTTELKTPEQLHKFQLFIDRIKDSLMREGPTTLLDLLANQLQLLIMCVYRRVNSGVDCGVGGCGGNTEDVLSVVCNLYIGDVLISEGEGIEKRESQCDAYQRAYERLVSTPIDSILADSRRLSKEELESPDVMDVIVKGQVRKDESNISRLRHQYGPVLEEMLHGRSAASMVIVEHMDWSLDRKRHAHCILLHSATWNIMLVVWSTEMVEGLFRCTVTLQGELCGEARSSCRQAARNLASANALFKMYEHHPVIKVRNVEDPSAHWITLDMLLDRMAKEELSERDRSDVDIDHVNHLTDNSPTDGSELYKQECSGLPVDDKKMDVTVQRQLWSSVLTRVKEFHQHGDILEELIFACDVPSCLRQWLRSEFDKLGLYCVQNQAKGNMYMCIRFRTSIDEVYRAMQDRGVVKTARFQLIADRSDLPRHSDITSDTERSDHSLPHADSQEPFNSDVINRSQVDSGNSSNTCSINGGACSDTEHHHVSLPSNPHVSCYSRPQEGSKDALILSCCTRASQIQADEDVHIKFANAMVSSGGCVHTPLSTESDSPVANILVNPPPLHFAENQSKTVGLPVIKNILLSPPRPGIPVSCSFPHPTHHRTSLSLPTLTAPPHGLQVSAACLRNPPDMLKIPSHSVPLPAHRANAKSEWLTASKMMFVVPEDTADEDAANMCCGNSPSLESILETSRTVSGDDRNPDSCAMTVDSHRDLCHQQQYMTNGPINLNQNNLYPANDEGTCCVSGHQKRLRQFVACRPAKLSYTSKWPQPGSHCGDICKSRHA